MSWVTISDVYVEVLISMCDDPYLVETSMMGADGGCVGADTVILTYTVITDMMMNAV